MPRQSPLGFSLALASGKQSDGEGTLSPAALAQQLDARLTQLKEQIISDYCSNRVQGEMVLLSILSTLADSVRSCALLPDGPSSRSMAALPNPRRRYAPLVPNPSRAPGETRALRPDVRYQFFSSFAIERKQYL
jgi:hypothetical protein